MSQLELRERIELRRRLTADVTAADFDAFCLDCFPAEHGRFTAGMDRTTRINLLLDRIGDDARVIHAFDVFLSAHGLTRSRRAPPVALWGGVLLAILALALGAYGFFARWSPLVRVSARVISPSLPDASLPIAPVPSAQAPATPPVHIEFKDHSTGQIVQPGATGVQTVVQENQR